MEKYSGIPVGKKVYEVSWRDPSRGTREFHKYVWEEDLEEAMKRAEQFRQKATRGGLSGPEPEAKIYEGPIEDLPIEEMS